jgi:DNA-binding transcriptional LysR family regulator
MNAPRIEFRHLRVVKAISLTQNLTRAAELLHVTQPAASQQLKELEEIVQTPLFVRTRKKMILTRAGEEILQPCARILDELGDFESTVARLIHGDAGELRIGMHCVISYQWLPKILKHMQLVYPKVVLSTGNAHRIQKELLEKTWDIIITIVPLKSTAIEAVPLFSDEVVLVAHPDDPITCKKQLSMKDLNGRKYISLTNSETDTIYKTMIHPAGVQLEGFWTVEQPEAILSLVRDGFGVTVFPKWAVLQDLDAGRLASVSLLPGGFQATWHAVRLKVGKYPSYHETFLRFCETALV